MNSRPVGNVSFLPGFFLLYICCLQLSCKINLLLLQQIMKAKKKIIRYVMLVASIIMLLSVVVPHHHHSNGMPCFKSLTTGTHEHKSASSHDCGCTGHNLALFTSLLSHASDLDVSHLLFPLQVLFDYINPPISVAGGQLFDRNRAFYIESLHDTWIAYSGGLRAPPVL